MICPCLSGRAGNGAASAQARAPTARLEEAVGLARAIALDIVGQETVILSHIRPATFLGKGKVAQVAALVEALLVDLVVMDGVLSPVQQRNLEKAFGAKVIDRTGLILEIFGQRARTREGTLQVELAHLAYQKSRLVRSWTHLERQRGGFGFLGGPGETQIETDRRLIQERMTRIERELESVKKRRGLHRTSRQEIPYPVIALVGYTNAGKSSLFNRLTSAGVPSSEMLFATLDPTLRGIRLPHGARVMLSDTVGFISDLPTMLVSAFRATLEEVIEADMILHVRDVSHADSIAQSADVAHILADLGIDAADERRIVEVWNKVDLLDADRRRAVSNAAQRRPLGRGPMVVSAATGEGIVALLAAIEERLFAGHTRLRVTLAASDGAGLHWLYENSEILDRSSGPEGAIHLDLRITPERLGRLYRRFPACRVM